MTRKNRVFRRFLANSRSAPCCRATPVCFGNCEGQTLEASGHCYRTCAARFNGARAPAYVAVAASCGVFCKFNWHRRVLAKEMRMRTPADLQLGCMIQQSIFERWLRRLGYMAVAVSALDAGCAPHNGCVAADRDRIQPLLTAIPFGQGRLSILTGRRVKERDARLQQHH